MTTTPPPLRMPALSTVVRGAMEECQNGFDAGFPDREDGTKPLSYNELVPTGNGAFSEIRCSRNKKTGQITVTIRRSAIRAAS